MATEGRRADHEFTAEEILNETKWAKDKGPQSDHPNSNGNGARPVPPHNVYPRNDAGNAMRLADTQGDAYRYNCDAKQWHHWEAGRWNKDAKSRVEGDVLGIADDLYGELRTIDTKEEQTKHLAWARASGMDSHVRGTLRRAQSMPPFPVVADELDADPLLLHAVNWTLELHLDGTWTVREHRPNDLITLSLATDYREAATSALWTDTLAYHLPSEPVRACLLRFAGMCLGGMEKEHVAIANGPQKTGKSTILGGMRATMGDYGQPMDITTLLRDRNPRPGAARPDLMALLGVRLAVVSEIEENTELNAALLKSLAGADERSGRALYKGQEPYKPTYGIIILCNDFPVLPANDEAVWDRVLKFPFLVERPRDKRDIAKRDEIKDPRRTGPAILWSLLCGWQGWCQRGRQLDPPDEVRSATQEARDALDQPGTFLRETMLFTVTGDAEDYVSVHDVRLRYDLWLGKTATQKERERFNRALERRGARKGQRGSIDDGRQQWFGLRWQAGG